MKIKDIAELLGSKATSLASLASLKVEALASRTRKDLLEVAKWLEVEGRSKMGKEQLAHSILEGLAGRIGKVRDAAVKGTKTVAAKARAATSRGAKPPPARTPVSKPAAGAQTRPSARPTAKVPPKPPARPMAKMPPKPLPAAVAKFIEKAAAKAPEKVATKAPEAPAAKPSKTVKAAKPSKAANAVKAKAVPVTPSSGPEVHERPETPGEDPGATSKLDIGPAGREEKPVAHIPWSYDVDRIVASAVDPDRLFAWWEVTDAAVERARASLGQGGGDSWLNVRIHDTTDLIFDGTNAHSVQDQGVDREARQWFFQIGRPTSSAHVEIGVLSRDGRFARIARSRRVDFPRKQPAHWQEPEWLTVVPGSGELHHEGTSTSGHTSGPDGAPAPGGPGGPGGPVGGGPGGRGEMPPPPFEPIALWRLHESGVDREMRITELLSAGWHRVEWREVDGEGWYELSGKAEWMEPLVRGSWEAGPFTYPVEVEPPSREEWRGPAVAFRVGGVNHIVYGPWQVVIKNIGAFKEHAVLARWEMYRSWVSEGGRVGTDDAQGGVKPAPGASENLGGSEMAWLRGSEIRLGGASETWRVGASELRLGGASELLAAGASERRLGGASEWQFQGASEWRLGGASERVLGGASERARLGASELRLGGSEGRLGGSENRLPDAGAARSPYPSLED